VADDAAIRQVCEMLNIALVCYSARFRYALFYNGPQDSICAPRDAFLMILYRQRVGKASEATL